MQTRVLGWLIAACIVAGCGGGGGGGGGGAPAQPSSTPGGSSGSSASSSPPPASPLPPVSPPPPGPASFPETVLAFTGTALSAPATPVVAARKLAMAVGPMVYDPAGDRLFISTVFGGSYAIVGLRPADLAVMAVAPTTSPVTALALSDDASQLYAGLFYESLVEQFDLTSGASVRRFPVAAGVANSGPFNIAVRPGAPDTIAVSIGTSLIVPTFAELALFTRGVRQPASYADIFGPRASEIAFVDANTLLGFDNETTAHSLSRFAVASGGITYSASTLGSCCFSSRLSAAGGRAFISRGMFVDPATLLSVKTLGRGPDGNLYHPGLDAMVQIHVENAGVAPNSVRLLVEEYDYSRGYLRRRFRVDETLPGTDPASGVFTDLYSAVPVGANSIAITVGDRFSGSSAVLVYDLDAIPALPTIGFGVQSVAQGGFAALAVALPAYAYAYDAAGDRIAATLGPAVGPQGNSLAVVRATDGAVERLVPLTSEPRNVGVSATGRLAYVSLPFENAVQAVDLSSGALLWKLRLQFESGTTHGFTPESIAVRPNDPQTIAVAGGGVLALLQNGAIAGPHANGLALSAAYFNGSNEVVALDGATTSAYMTRFALSGTVLTQTALVSGMLDIGGSVRNKVGEGFAYGPYALADINANRRAGRFANGSGDFAFFDETLLLSATLAVGHNQRLSPAAEFYELAQGSLQSDGSVLFAGQSRLRLTDERFNQGFRGVIVPAGPNRFAQSFVRFADGIGVLYLISIP